MTLLSHGIAHVSFSGGGIFLPVRTPYDRETLMEHVANRVRAKGLVQVLVDDQRWLVRLIRERSAAVCSGCSHPLDAACYATAGKAYCVKCAFAGRAEPGLNGQERVRRAS